ncbi:RCC1 domain-containing protein [Pseudomonas sp. NUPR-001]|uniref:RCC1 domain-containing protein n=1 Tax=Pseudomonas sp. NUPR-001 TaxID=3416058 RepID=UPI003F946DE4
MTLSEKDVAKDMRATASPKALKVLGARSDRSTYATSRSPRHLSAFNAKGEPLKAQWQYIGDNTWENEERFLDSKPHLILEVRFGEDRLYLNPANIIGNGTAGESDDKMGNGAFVALRDDGRVVGWGTPSFGGQVSDAVKALSDVVEVSSTTSAFAVRRRTGQVHAWGKWGNEEFGGDMRDVPSQQSFTSVIGGGDVFIALNEASMVAWGHPNWGGQIPSEYADLTNIKKVALGSTSVTVLYSPDEKKGSVVGWGEYVDLPDAIKGLINIVDIKSSSKGFAALCRDLTVDGKVVAWGDESAGGVVSKEVDQLTDIDEIFCANPQAFVVKQKKEESTRFYAWGDQYFGGEIPEEIKPLENVVEMASTEGAFAAVKSDGSVVAWGNSGVNGFKDGGKVPADIAALTDIVQVTGSAHAFAVLRRNGQVRVWGDWRLGGDTKDVDTELYNIQAIYRNAHGFVALREDRRVIAWGYPDAGGDLSAVRGELDGCVSYLATEEAVKEAIRNSKEVARA